MKITKIITLFLAALIIVGALTGYTSHKVLMFHDVIKRLSDGKILRITSDGDDKAAPPSASLNMRICTAEEWTLPR